MSLFGITTTSRLLRKFKTARVQLQVETLEARVVPYALSGNAWPHPELVTISFVPDGTIVGTNNNGYVYSNLFAKMNARFGSPATWERQILAAAQAWAAQTNINVAVVADNGTPIGQGSYQQGDSGMGDIRIGGYAFSTSILATTFMPPPANNYSIAGDMQFNTQVSWNVNSTYDLFTVAAHEMGHALGLNHSGTSSAEMYSSYGGIKNLTADDVAGARGIYSGGNARAVDSYDAASPNGTNATASDLSGTINSTTLTALVPNLDITSTADVDTYTFLAPSGSSPTLTVGLQSAGLSLLTPLLSVSAADGSTSASASGAGQLGGSSLVVSINNVTPGEQFYVRVAGADATAMSTGKYALTLNFGTGSSPSVSAPNTQTADSANMHAGGGQAETSGPCILGGLGNGLLSTVTYVVNALAAQLGVTLEVAQGLLNGTADAQSVSAAADASLDRTVELAGQPSSAGQTPTSPATRLLVQASPAPGAVDGHGLYFVEAASNNFARPTTEFLSPAIFTSQSALTLQTVSRVFSEVGQSSWNVDANGELTYGNDASLESLIPAMGIEVSSTNDFTGGDGAA